VVIVLPPNPAWTLLEQFRRLAARRRDLALVVAVGIAGLWGLCILFAVGPAVLAVILSNQDPGVLWVGAALLTLIGVGISKRIGSRGHRLFLEIAGTMVAAATKVESPDPPSLTSMERRGLRQAKQELEELEAGLTASGPLHFAAIREAFVRKREQFAPLYCRPNIGQRVQLIEMILMDAGQAESRHAGIYSTALFNLSCEARESIDRVLNGRPPSAGAATWPYAYEQDRINDRVDHNGEPVALRRLIQGMDSWKILSRDPS
jgi:hypothetical protein